MCLAGAKHYGMEQYFDNAKTYYSCMHGLTVIQFLKTDNTLIDRSDSLVICQLSQICYKRSGQKKKTNGTNGD